MLNHFRTLLVNLDYAGIPSEHIPKGYTAKILPQKLQAIYDILFPPATSRYFKLFLAQNYLKLIEAAGFGEEITKNDPRISYSTETDEYFKLHRLSNPRISHQNFPIYVSGTYTNPGKSNFYYDNFLITQIGNSNKLLIYSTVNKVYYNQKNSFKSVVPEAEVEATFNLDGLSEQIFIGNTGISFRLSGGAEFSTIPDKNWEFLVEYPYKFDFLTIFRLLEVTGALKSILEVEKEQNVEKYVNILQDHPNLVFKMAAFLILFVRKVENVQ